ncbi:Tectonic-1 [Labeo rohita]|uniref:Tectonic-1 n=1 Tax=Labeo rohita TaxID=84645 RepID=A0ABQ8MAW7_LABRO|nr:Tectonic-1 [Labeo rohita]
MALLCCLIILTYLRTALCIEDTNTTGNVNITFSDTNDTSADREKSLDFKDPGVSETPVHLPDPTAWTPESVTAFPDHNESPESSIPDTNPESPRAATAAQPLPLSGVLPSPVTEVSQLCPCNLQNGQCDINCCCDPDCTEELALFTDCTVERVSPLSSETSTRMSSVFNEEGLSFGTPAVPTEENFDSLFGRFLGFFFGRLTATSTLQSPDVGNSTGYQEQTSRCMRSFDLAGDCETLEALRLETYINFNIRSVIGVEVAAITLQSLEGTQTSVDSADLASYIPVLLETGDVCNNVVQQVKYAFRYNEVGEILNVMASVLLGAIKSVTVPIQQEFQISFMQDISNTPVLQFSGNPGYVVGRPLSADPKGSLTILQNSGEMQDCLSGSSLRSPVLFGIDMVSGCTLKLSDGANCSLVSEVILWALKGQSFPDHIASFGNSLPQNPLDWVPIQNQTIASGTQACSIPLSYHLEVKWTKYGALVNPQAQIVSVMETIITNTSSLALLTSADGLLSVTSSVSFVDVSASASPGFKVPPTIDAKLPFDFFFPFV